MLDTLEMFGMILMILLMFTVMVVVHEWGHYITAKKFGVLVHEFAIGMGPVLWSKQKGETLYSIRLLPIGGFCRMEEETGESTNPRAMASKKPWQKLIILAAGAFMNFILAWVLLAIIFIYAGVSSNVIQQVTVGSPAEKAGLMAGDKIVRLDGQSVANLDDIKAIQTDKIQTYHMEVERNGEILAFDITTQVLEKDGKPVFGFVAKRDRSHILTELKASFLQMIEMTKLIWDSFVQLITRTIGIDQMSGIVGIVDAGGQVWNKSMSEGGLILAILNMLNLTALLSANLGVVNLLPLPALDGGRIFFVLVEMIRGKAIPAEKEGAVHLLGMILLMLLTVVVLYNDIMRLI